MCWKQAITQSILDLLHVAKVALNSCNRYRKYHGYGEQNLDVEGLTCCTVLHTFSTINPSFELSIGRLRLFT